MKLTQVSVAVVCVALTIAACQKDQYNSRGKTSPSAKSGKQDRMRDFFAKNMEERTEHFKIRADKESKIVTEDGVVFHIDANSLHNPDGSITQGVVDVAVFVAADNSDRALANFTTEAAWNPDQGEDQDPLLTSAVSFDIEMKNQQGQEVGTTADGGVEVDVPAAIAGGDPDEGMTVWEGEQSADQERDKQWEENGIPLEIVGTNYRFTLPLPCNRINLDRRVTDWTSAIRLRVGLSSGYTSANAEVFVFFPAITGVPGTSNMTASMDVYDFTTNYFGEHGGFTDPNQPLEIVAIGYDPVTNALMYSHASIVTTVNDGSGGHLTMMPPMMPGTTAGINALIASF